ncbi:metallophosphoesterase family protein [Thermoleophilia bacterium SCSIO 60948]|nr:metallophosphoesterase family protein [Thermoleophilia bacterium SCSIO 60948]
MPAAPAITSVQLDRASARAISRGATVALISDTHMPKGERRLPERCVETIAAAALVIHAGDVSTEAVLDEVAAIGPPLLAVHGNVDSTELRTRVPAAIELEIGPRRLAVVHDSGARKGRAARMRRWFPAADAVVFGHSHIPLHEADPATGLELFNPGSPTERRRSPTHTMGTLRLVGGELRFELVELS